MANLYSQYIKRSLDIVAGLASLPIVIASLLICAPLIKADDGGPVFYVSQRRGYKGKLFKMYKFRSMKVNAPLVMGADGGTLSSAEDSRLTRVGSFLRRTSIDELPQLLNVLKGDMSLIGPRPNMPGDDPSTYSWAKRHRLEAKPGITGYSQAYFRNSISPDERYELDCYYVDNISFSLDAMILLKTVETVLSSKNINANNGGKEVRG